MTMLRERDVLLHPSWTGDARKVLDRAADRHGGWTAWRTLGPLHVVCTRFEGALARLKGHGKTFQFGEAVVQPREQTVDIKPARPAGLEIAYRQGRLHWTEPGDPIVRRTAALPRNRFSGLRRLARWDEQDSAYFEG